MSKEKILEVELDKVTDKLFLFGKPKERIKLKKTKSKEATTLENGRAAASSQT